MDNEIVRFTDFHLIIGASIGAERSAACLKTETLSFVIVRVSVIHCAIRSSGNIHIVIPSDETKKSKHHYEGE